MNIPSRGVLVKHWARLTAILHARRFLLFFDFVQTFSGLFHKNDT